MRTNRSCPPSLRRSALAAALALWCVPSPRFAYAQEAGLRRVRVRLDAGTLAATLPFDERFVLVGRAPPELEAVALVVLAHVEDRDCVSVAEGEPGVTPTRPWTRPAALPADSFFVRVGELPPNRSFDFCFRVRRRPAPEEGARLRTAWRAALDSALAGWRGSPGPDAGGRPTWQGREPTAQDLAAFRDALVRRIDPPGDAVRVRLGEKALLRASPATVARELLVAEALAAQLARDQAALDFGRAADATAIALRGLAGEDPARDALASLRVRSEREIRSFAELHAAGLAVAAALQVRTDEALDRVAGGQRSLLTDLGGAWSASGNDAGERAGPAPPASWEPPDSVRALASVAARTAGLVATRDELVALLAACRALRLDAATREAAGLEPAGLDDLIERLAAALGALQGQLGHAGALAAAAARRERLVDAAADRLSAIATADALLEATSLLSLETRAKALVTADFGFAWLPETGDVTPALGANFYLRPVNRDRPLGFPDLGRRFSVTLGITTSSLARTGEREDLTGSLNLVGGVGFRVLDFVRVGAGGLLGRRPEERGDAALDVTPYLSLTLDLVLKDVLRDLFGGLF